MIHYRDAEPHEGATLGGIARATFIETFGHLYNLNDLASFLEKGSDTAQSTELADPALEVRFACAGSTPIGFAKLSGITLPVEPAGPAIELRQLYIFKPWHGQGIAEALMDWVHTRAAARSAQEIWLSVWAENHRARRFYARQGFTEIRPYAFMVGEQADEDILCRKVLK